MQTRRDLALRAIREAEILAKNAKRKSNLIKLLNVFISSAVIVCGSMITIFAVVNQDPAYIALGTIITILKTLSSTFDLPGKYVALRRANVDILRESRSLSLMLATSPSDDQIQAGVFDLYERITKTELKLIEQEAIVRPTPEAQPELEV